MKLELTMDEALIGQAIQQFVNEKLKGHAVSEIKYKVVDQRGEPMKIAATVTLQVEA